MPATAMTGATMKELFETIVDDSLDETAFYLLLNSHKDILETEMDLEILVKLDESQSATTSAITLPTDFQSPILLYVASNTTPYKPVPFTQKPIFQNQSGYYYIDYKNNQYYLCGTPDAGLVRNFYKYRTPDIEATTSPVWPTAFHKLLPLEMAKLYYPIDQGDRSASWDDKWEKERLVIRNAMITWNENLRKRAHENGLGITDLYGLATES